MIHIALNHYSRKGLNKPWEENCKPSRLYTAPGLGDRVTCLWGLYQYGRKERAGIPLTVHLNKNHWISNDSNVDKPSSWQEIRDLFPRIYAWKNQRGDSIRVRYHEDMPIQNDYNTLKWLREKNINASMYYYDKPDVKFYHGRSLINITDYFKDKVLLDPPKCDHIKLPEKFITMQFDGSLPRRPSNAVIERLRLYYINNGYKIIDIGKNMTLAEIGYYLYHADYHVGMESGMFHMAQLWKKHSQIHIYTPLRDGLSYHTDHITRAVKNGSPLNYLLGKII